MSDSDQPVRPRAAAKPPRPANSNRRKKTRAAPALPGIGEPLPALAALDLALLEPAGIPAPLAGLADAPAQPAAQSHRKRNRKEPKAAPEPFGMALDAVLPPPAPAQPEPASRAAPGPRRAKATSITITRPDGTRSSMEIGTGRTRRPAEQVRIFQIYYEPWHLELLDPAFEPFDNSGVFSEFLELDVFSRIAPSEQVKSARLWGALSWRFGEKTGMSGEALRDTIQSNPGFDIYYCNPYPENEALFHNMWMQGETCHPRFLEVARAVFAAAGLPEEELSAVETSEMFSAANYFVGSQRFWSLYLAFVRRVMGLSDSRMSREMRDLLHSPEADRRLMHNGATYVAFVIERLFPVFMKTAGRHLKKFKVPLPEKDANINVHLRLLREMKDVAHKTRSAWLAACWINYRNLYFAQSSGKEWCARHLRDITPTTVQFG